MSALIVRALLKTPLDDNLVTMVLENVEGFAPEGVKKADWKMVFDDYATTPDPLGFLIRPDELRKEITKKNDTFGVKRWYRVIDNEWKVILLLAYPSVHPQLIGREVYITRCFDLGREPDTGEQIIEVCEFHVKIKEVNLEANIFLYEIKERLRGTPPNYWEPDWEEIGDSTIFIQVYCGFLENEDDDSGVDMDWFAYVDEDDDEYDGRRTF